MPSAFLSRNSFNHLKQAARQQLPGVQHAHALEALARALGQNNLAALKERLATGEDNAPHFFLFSYDDLRIRLLQLGYQDATTWDLDFSGVTDVFRVKRPFPTTLDALVADGIISPEHRRHLDRLIDQRKSILIIGATGSGKSLLMHVLLNEMAVRDPRDEFVVCELTRDASSYPSNVTQLDVTRLLNIESARGPREGPDFGHRRVAMDEITDELCSRVFRTWAACGGGLGTMYGLRADEVLARMSCLEGGREPKMLREAIDVVVRMERSDRPRVVEILTQAELENLLEPPEFPGERREHAARRQPLAEETGRFVQQDLREMMSTLLSAGGITPLAPNVPIIHDVPLQDTQRRKDGLSFQPKHWRQFADGSWFPANMFGTSSVLFGSQMDPLMPERLDEMRRILADGGRMRDFDPKVDADTVKAINKISAFLNQDLTIELPVGQTAKVTHELVRKLNERRGDLPVALAGADASDDSTSD